MPCLALGKGLFPAIKTWKRITRKLLQKLHPCKFIKISKTRRANVVTRYKAPPSSMYYPSLSAKKNQRSYKAKDRRQLFGGASKALHRPKRQFRFKKQSLQAPPPVFIDELFWAHPNDAEEGLPGSGGPKGKVETVTRSAVVGSSNGFSTYGSSQLNGIDARAEEFINRFRAELENQEIGAHLL